MSRFAATGRFAAACSAIALVLIAGACSGPITMTSAKTSTRPAQRGEAPQEQERPLPPVAAQYRNASVRGQLREQAMGLLVAAASGASPYGPEEKANAIEALQGSPGRLASIIPQALTDPAPAVRAVAAMTVGKAQMISFAPLVEPLLSDPSVMVRSAAIYALKRCRQEVDLSPLADMLVSRTPQVRAQGAFILGEIGERSALGLLRDAAKDTMLKANTAATRLMDLQIAEARVKLGDEVALAEVRSALYVSRPDELEGTALAAQILGEVLDRGSIDRLIYLTASMDNQKQMMPAEVRLAAAGSLAKLGLRQGSFIAHEYRTSTQDPLRAQAAFVFGETRKMDNLVVLDSMMADPVPRVRVAVAAAVIKITDSGDGLAEVEQ